MKPNIERYLKHNDFGDDDEMLNILRPFFAQILIILSNLHQLFSRECA